LSPPVCKNITKGTEVTKTLRQYNDSPTWITATTLKTELGKSKPNLIIAPEPTEILTFTSLHPAVTVEGLKKPGSKLKGFVCQLVGWQGRVGTIKLV